jgi:3',5'-cyclic-AMP phosphodiesterase
MPTILHFSDPHLDSSPVRTGRLIAVLEDARIRRPDAIVATGDITDHGRADQYQAFARCLSREGIPWLTVPGNHDHPETMRRELGVPTTPTLDLSDGTRIIGLDVTVPGSDHGHLSEVAAREAVAAARGAARTILALHQPPVRTGHSFADTMLTDNPVRLSELVAALPAVTAILCGHVHTAFASSLDGTPVLIAPGVVSTLNLDASARPLTDSVAPPGYALHQVEHSRIATTFRYVWVSTKNTLAFGT